MTAPHDETDPRLEPPADPELDALLDQTLGRDEVPPYLADRVVEATLPELRRAAGPAPVLARIGPSLRVVLRVAAVVLVGAIVTLALVNAPSDEAEDEPGSLAHGESTAVEAEPPSQPEITGPSLAEALAPLNQLDAALAQAAPREEALDAELNLLAMRVELAASDQDWSDAASLLDASLTAMEFEQADRLSSMTF